MIRRIGWGIMRQLRRSGGGGGMLDLLCCVDVDGI